LSIECVTSREGWSTYGGEAFLVGTQNPLHCGGHVRNSQTSLCLLNATFFLKNKLMPSLRDCNGKKKKKSFFLSFILLYFILRDK